MECPHGHSRVSWLTPLDKLVTGLQGEEPSSHILKDDYEFGRRMGAGASQGVRVLERGGEQW